MKNENKTESTQKNTETNPKKLTVATAAVLVACVVCAAIVGTFTVREYFFSGGNNDEEEIACEIIELPAVIIEYGEEDKMPTVKDFLLAAIEPVGKCLYIYGGGWNEEDTGAGVEAMSYGVSPRWIEFFDEQDNTYKQEEHEYEIHNGLDCTGYLGYSVYQVFGDRYADDGYVFTSGTVGDNYLRLFGGKLVPKAMAPKHRAGDIMNRRGHVWIALGECDDGSVLMLQASPPHVSFCGTPTSDGDKNSEAVMLAKKVMKTIVPEAFGRYSQSCSCGTTYLTDYHCYSFPEEVLPDPDGLREMTAAEVVAELFG